MYTSEPINEYLDKLTTEQWEWVGRFCTKLGCEELSTTSLSRQEQMQEYIQQIGSNGVARKINSDTHITARNVSIMSIEI
jgi:hypothetical protein